MYVLILENTNTQQIKSLPPCRQLPCGHEYCRACVEELRQKGVDKSCPLCRKPLPPGPEKLFDLGYGMFIKIKGAIDRSRPRVDTRTPWPSLSTEQQGEMDQAVAMLREAADQGHKMAQATCGNLYNFGMGVAKDDRLALVYGEKAAQQGHVTSQYNTGEWYCRGQGCEQNYGRAADWWGKAARQGDIDAMNSLGCLYRDGGICHEFGVGVTQNYQEARRLYALASAHGVDELNQLEEKIRTECPFLGKQVVITGTSREDLNGRTGTAASFDHARGRYVVELDVNGESQKHKLKPENLALCPGRRGGKKKKTTKTKTETT